MKANSHISALAPYALADLSVAAGTRLISLAQNESARPPSPQTIDAATEAMAEAHLYPDPDWSDLRRAISDVHGIEASEIICGAGSMELIGALAAAFLGTEDRALTTDYAYLFFRTATQLAGSQIDLAPEYDLTVDIDTVLSGLRAETKIVFIANPGNPTGTRIPRSELLRLRDGLPANVLLVIDEAYGEFADNPGEATFDLVARGDTVVLRTLSKAYGLAGLRVGWGVFPETIAAQVRKILNPNNVSIVAQAVAIAAMRDQDYMRETLAETARRRDRFADQMRSLGIVTPPSHTNFVLLQFASSEQAQAADATLRAEGILMRGMAGYGLGDCLRATIGADDDMKAAADCLTRFMKGAT